jgi:hypothetical protein
MIRINYNKGDIIGKLIFLEDVNIKKGSRKAFFQCPLCQNQFKTEISRAKSLRTVSCGCYRKINSSIIHTTHGQVKGGKMSPEYVSWQRAIQRCQNPNYGGYKNYGGKGIKVCDRWKYSFSDFLQDMGKKPFKSAQIDRIDSNGNYEPSNCRWVSCKENARNRSNNLVISWNGENKTLSEWSEILKLDKNTLRNRLYSKNWTLEESMTTPLFKKGQKRNL